MCTDAPSTKKISNLGSVEEKDFCTKSTKPYRPWHGGLPPLPPPPMFKGEDWRGVQGFVNFVQKS